ncbi:Dabb family protein [Gordonia sp. NPDC003424]
MYEVTRLIGLGDPADDAAATIVTKRLTAAATAAAPDRMLVERTLPGVRNGGDLIVHLQFDSPADWQLRRDGVDAAGTGPLIAHVDGVEYHAGPRTWCGRRRDAFAGTVYRTLLLRVDDSASPEHVADFERSLLRMPHHMDTMIAWQLSPVTVATGASPWTHVWEQEFTDLDGLMGQYMNHPVHWAHVDQWFDPENPNCIVKDRVCHSFCRLDAPLLDMGPTRLSSVREH